VPVAAAEYKANTEDTYLNRARAAVVIEYACRPGNPHLLPLPSLRKGERHIITIAIAPKSNSSLLREHAMHHREHGLRAEMIWSAEFTPASSLGVPPDGLGEHAQRRQRGAVKIAVVPLGGPVSFKCARLWALRSWAGVCSFRAVLLFA